jgi:uridylate kinase
MLKLSGEVLAGEKGFGIDYGTVEAVCSVIAACVREGVQIGIVVGGGNFWRGRQNGEMERTRADNVGMLATVMNSIVLNDSLALLGVDAVVMSALEMPKFAEYFTRDKAVAYLDAGKVVIFACGTGNPFFSTDSAAALRGAEIGAEVYFKATNVDGVYDKDPNKFADAVKYDALTHDEVLAKNLGVMDATAAALCRDNALAVLVFNLTQPENILKAVTGERVGTLIQ